MLPCSRIRNDTGEMIEGDDLVNFMGHYYAENGKRLASAFTDSNVISQPDDVDGDGNFLFRFIPLDIVEKYVNSIDISKSSGITDISSKLIRDAFKVLTVELTFIINESLRLEVFPDDWALGSITPIPKEGDRLDPGNWRPITILPIPSKLMEKAVHYQIITFLDDSNYLDVRQHGFRKGKSTSTAIMEITRKLFSNYNQNLHTSCVFVDYKKASETLDHKITLQKLKQLGFDASSLRWVESYLGNRRHIVKCANMSSSEINVHYGVPQGSILGPLYFIIYVNDFFTKISTRNNLSIIMYADDTVLLRIDTSGGGVNFGALFY